MFAKKLLFATAFILIAIIATAGYLHLSKPKPALAQTVPAPVLHFSDLTSGPKTGLGDGLGSGAIVTIWGVNLGSTQGTSKVYVGNVEAAYVYEWTNATQHPGHPADLYTYHKMQTIAFSVPATAVDGANTIKVIVNGVTSNTLPFTVRTGNIYHVKTTGSDSNTGSYASPWLTMGYAVNAGMTAGDIAYVYNGVTQSGGISVHKTGTITMPLALISYPGASTTVSTPQGGYGFGNNMQENGYWVFSKLFIQSGESAIGSFTNVRGIANEVTEYPGHCSQGWGGVIGDGGTSGSSGMKFLGNYIHNEGCDTTTKMHHTFYISNRQAHMMEGVELGWNFLKDNKTNHGLHIYDESYCGDWSSPLLVHDNVVVNQRGTGTGYFMNCDANIYVTVGVKIYNNLFINVGLGPGFFDGGFIGSAIAVGGWSNKSVVDVYNNTIYGYSDPDAMVDSGLNFNTNFVGTLNFRNNIIVDTKNHPYTSAGYNKAPATHTNNLYYNGGDGNPASPPSWETAPLTSDPLLVNPGAGVYSLQSGSPAIDAGISLISTVANDIEGITRPQGLAFDIGAYEYATSTPPLPPPLKGDFNSDNKVNDLDFTSFKNAFKSIFNSLFDLNSDNAIDVKDLGVLMSGWLP